MIFCLPYLNASCRKETYFMISITLDFSDDIVRLQIWIATMIDKATLISVIHCINTQWKEILLGALLHFNLIFICIIDVVHIEQVAHSNLIIYFSSVISFLRREYFANILNDKSTSRNGFHCKETPHCCRFFDSIEDTNLLCSFNEDFPFMPRCLLFHEEIHAEIFVTRTKWMTFIKSK